MASWLKLLALALALPAALAAPTPPHGATIITKRSDLHSSYDYVIVGGGTSGLVVGNRLSENPNIKVLVIEAGDWDAQDENILVPRNVNNAATGNSWVLDSEPMTELNNRVHNFNIGKVVGGSSAINGMAFDRGAKMDYDSWEWMGNPGWSWDDLLPYFRKSESFNPPSDELVQEFGIEFVPSAHGYTGPIKNSYPSKIYPVAKVSYEAFRQIGADTPKDGAAGTAIGVFWTPSNLNYFNGTRSYARNEYADPIAHRPNFHILVKNHVTKLLHTKIGSNYKFTGVEYAPDAESPRLTVQASREVIMAAGAIHTPRILKLSGIGPQSQLSSHGIQTIINLPGVGENLQDHPAMFCASIMANPPPGGDISEIVPGNPAYDAAVAEYAANKTGPLTIGQGNSLLAFIPLKQVAGLINTAKIITKGFLQPSSQYLRSGVDITVKAGYALQKTLLLSMLASSEAAATEVSGGAGGGALALQKTFSRGFVDLKSSDPFDLPKVDFRAFTNPLDFDIMIESFKYMRRLQTMPAIAATQPMEVFPGPSVQTDEQIKDFIKNSAWPTFAHWSGTAIMLKRALGGVVDHNLKVYGSTNLRVVDASMMPLVPSTHIQSTVYAVAEKAADIIKAAQ